MASAVPVLLRRPGSFGAVQRLRALPAPVLLGVAALLGLLLGGLTSYGQTVLPDAISSVANSSGGWTLVTVLVVALLKRGPGWSAVFAPVCFTGLTLGYQVVSTMRGYPTSELFFLAAGLVVGPFVGVATAWLRRRGWRPALAAALLGGIGIGEGLDGLLVLLGSTSPVYWSLDVAGGVALVAVVCVRRTTRGWHRVAAIAGAAVVAAAFLLAYSGGSVLTGLLDL